MAPYLDILDTLVWVGLILLTLLTTFLRYQGKLTTK